MLRTATDTRAAKKALVRTYDQPSYRDLWRVGLPASTASDDR